jgi:hypothetical protein
MEQASSDYVRTLQDIRTQLRKKASEANTEKASMLKKKLRRKLMTRVKTRKQKKNQQQQKWKKKKLKTRKTQPKLGSSPRRSERNAFLTRGRSCLNLKKNSGSINT